MMMSQEEYDACMAFFSEEWCGNCADYKGDITLWFGNANSPGGKATQQACKDAHDTPFIDVTDWTPEAIAALLWYRRVKVVNIAGNRESTNPGIQDRVQQKMLEAFKEYKMLEEAVCLNTLAR